jgi:hypothetical protein
MSGTNNPLPGAVETAKQIAAALDRVGCEYALGGAIALGFWTAPRGTLDVDVTLFLPPEKPSQCVRVLQQIGCEVTAADALESLTKHGFCQVALLGRRIDVFLPLLPFYEEARRRRKQVVLSDQPVMIWDAESLCVFKMMFFRRKDIADVEQILRAQEKELDRNWILERLEELYSVRDSRISQWQELVKEVGA